jgi:alpha-maltose-1-phosphate synthase
VEKQKQKRIILSHPTGNANSAALARALAMSECLSTFATSLSISKDNSIVTFAKNTSNSFIRDAALRLERRAWLDPELGHTSSNPTPELFRVAARSLRLHRLLGLPEQRLTDYLYRSHDAYTARLCDELKPSHVWAYEDGALKTFQAAKRLGITTIYELPLVHYKAKHSALTSITPALNELLSLSCENSEPASKLVRKDEELALADIVIVPSDYARSCLPLTLAESKTVHVIPYGCDCLDPVQRTLSDQFTALAVGHVNLRKGSHDLLLVWNELQLPNAQLELIGSVQLPQSFLKEYIDDSVCLLGSYPHSRLANAYARADVLVFPSYCDGFGLVLLEAMSAGLPVIASVTSGAPHFIEDGVNGFLIEPGNRSQLKARLEWCANNRERLMQMGLAAKRTAREWGWNRYGREVEAFLEQLA